MSADAAAKPPGESTAPADKEQPGGSASGWVQASRFSYVGIFFGVAVFLGFLFGRWLDRKFGTDPWLMLVGVLFGIASGFKELYRLTASYRTEQKKKP
ncbi:MAG TPA: AtpZ/AtpI family protein [Pseudomonadota bacterium]|nr:AtpZ/AtpI family protein [Pseudomonadota bacterium]